VSTPLLVGDVWPEWSPETDERGDFQATLLTVYFIPSYLECRLCGLHLRGTYLHAAGIPAEHVLDSKDVHSADFIETEGL
jgi:hypothetical protein